jgi:hypothetical protein
VTRSALAAAWARVDELRRRHTVETNQEERASIARELDAAILAAHTLHDRFDAQSREETE